MIYQLKLIFSLFFIAHINVFSQGKFSKWDFSSHYNQNAAIKIQHLAIKNKDSVVVFLKLQLNRSLREFYNLQKQNLWTLNLRMCESYESKNSEWEQTLFVKPYEKIDNLIYLKFTISSTVNESAILFLAGAINELDDWVIDIPIKSMGEFAIPSSYLLHYDTGELVYDKYVKVNDTLKLIQMETKFDSVYYYKYTFQQATPPMVESPTFDAGLRLVIDSTFAIKNKTIIVTKKGNYNIGNDKNHLNFVAYENKFPKPSKIKELIDPVIYIASDAERSLLKLSPKPKLKLDEFWMKLGYNKEKSRRMIKGYYHRVMEANQLFTGHKEGWKMDKGMIYIVFGAPEQVLKTDISETWYFSRSDEPMPFRFIFVKKYSPFGDLYFELQNDSKYTNIWYKSIETWRRGDNFR